MEELLTVEIDPKTMDYLQYLYYENLSYKSIMEDILTEKRKYKHNTETCAFFMDKYSEAFSKFELAKQDVIIEYAGRKYVEENANEYIYNFNFLDRLLTIYKRGECQQC